MLLVAALFCLLISFGSTVPNQDILNRNWALGKQCSQSSDYVRWGEASHAVDGNTSGTYDDRHCTHTKFGDKHPWWMVDVGAMLAVESVTIFNRVDCCSERLHDFYVEVLQTPDDKSPGLCHHQVSAVGRSATFRCESPLYGRYVRIRKDNLSGDTDVLTLCEVQVNGKKDCSNVVQRLTLAKRQKICKGLGIYWENMCKFTCGKCSQSDPNCKDNNDKTCKEYTAFMAQDSLCDDPITREECLFICYRYGMR